MKYKQYTMSNLIKKYNFLQVLWNNEMSVLTSCSLYSSISSRPSCILIIYCEWVCKQCLIPLLRFTLLMTGVPWYTTPNLAASAVCLSMLAVYAADVPATEVIVPTFPCSKLQWNPRKNSEPYQQTFTPIKTLLSKNGRPYHGRQLISPLRGRVFIKYFKLSHSL